MLEHKENIKGNENLGQHHTGTKTVKYLQMKSNNT